MRRAVVILLGAAVALAGCSGPSKSDAPPAPPVAEQPASSANQNPQPAQKHPIDEWNDRALTLIRQKDWEGAIAAAQKALELDRKSSSAWFNLGRAYLGASQPDKAVEALREAAGLTQFQNADVQYFLGKAYEVDGLPALAAETYGNFLRGAPGDQEMAAALQELTARYAPLTPPAAERDLDGDGKAERVHVEPSRVLVLGAGGQSLYEAKGEGVADRLPSVDVYRIKGAPPLVHIAWPACPYAPLNEFLWYDQGAGRIVSDGLIQPCMVYLPTASGDFEVIYRALPFIQVNTVRWENGTFTSLKNETRLVGGVNDNNLGYVLGVIAQGNVANAAEIFANPALLDTLRSKVTGQAVILSVVAGKGTKSLRYQVEQDGKLVGYLTVTFQGEKITDLMWQ